MHRRAALTPYVIFGLKPRPTRLRHANQDGKMSNIIFETDPPPSPLFFLNPSMVSWIPSVFPGFYTNAPAASPLATEYHQQTGSGFKLLHVAELVAISQVCVPAGYTYCKL